MKKHLLRTLMVVSMTLGLLGNSLQARAAELVPMKLAFATWVGSGPFYIAKEKGFFAEHGLDVEIKIVDDESAYAALMASESIDALAQVIDREVINHSKGVQEKVIMAYDQSTGGDGIVASKTIQSVKGLKGKTIALDKSSTSYFFFLTAITKAGLNESDVTIKDMDADAAGTAFVQGLVDAAVTWEPWISNASQREGGHLLAGSDKYPNTIVDGVSVTKAFVTAHPKEVAGFVAAWNAAIAWYNDGHQAEGDKIMSDGLSIGLDDFKSQLQGVTWYDKDSMKTFFDQSKENNIYSVGNRAISFWVERKLIDKPFDSAELITDQFIEQ